MRIVQLVETLEIGGLERLAADLALAQSRSGHAPSIYCLFHPGAFAPEVEAAGIPVISFGKKPGFSLGAIRRMARRLRQDKADILHTHNAMIHHYGVAAARLARVPVVVNTRHGLNLIPPNPKAEKIFKATLPWTDAVVLVSENGREFFVRERGIPRRKTRVILNGIPVEKFAACRARPGSVRPRIRFGTVGRLVPAKDHLTLLKAFSQGLQRLPQAELHILGDGPLREQIENAVRELNLRAQVRLYGAGLEVAGFLSALDIFVLSSATEGLPVVILEAMAAGLPLVSTRVGGIPEAVPEGSVAYFCPPSQPEALAEAMVEAAQDTALAARGENARHLAEQRFGIRKMWMGYQALFEELLAHRNSGRRQRGAGPASDNGQR